MNTDQVLSPAVRGEPVTTGIESIVSGRQTIRTDNLAQGLEMATAGTRRDQVAGGNVENFGARWGKRIAAFAVGLATIVATQVVTAPSARAYVYTKGTSALVYIDSVTPIFVTPPNPQTQYPHKTLRNISPPSVRIWRNGVPSYMAQGVQVQHKLWRYNGSGWAQLETRNWGGVISAGNNTVYATSAQFYLQMPSAYYFIETTVTLLGSNGVWLYRASIRPNTVNDFSCTAACVRYNDYVYVS